MEKIRLLKKEREILLQVHKGEYTESKDDAEVIDLLHRKKLIDCVWAMGHVPMAVCISDYGKSYIFTNPKLKNPSIWDDKKYVLNTAISVIAILISAVALYISIKNK